MLLIVFEIGKLKEGNISIFLKLVSEIIIFIFFTKNGLEFLGFIIKKVIKSGRYHSDNKMETVNYIDMP